MLAYLNKFDHFWHRANAAVREFFFLPPSEHDVFSFEDAEIALLLEHTAGPDVARVDFQTWRDLLVDRYFGSITAGTSIFGKQIIYRRLAMGLAEPEQGATPARIKQLLDDRALLSELDKACLPLRRARVDIARLLFSRDNVEKTPFWAPFVSVIGIAFLASMIVAINSSAGWVASIMLFAMLMLVRFRYSRELQGWDLTLDSLHNLLRVCNTLATREEPLLQPFQDIRTDAARAQRAFSKTIAQSIPYLKDYLNWFLLVDVMSYLGRSKKIDKHIACLRRIYFLVSNLEGDMALARHLATVESICWASMHENADIVLDQVVNPLLLDGIPLSFELKGKGAFISGKNGIGKSTLLRTIGLNLIAARAFGFCYARKAIVPDMLVYASMQNEDSLARGESLYIAELRRAHELLKSAKGSHPGIYLIDEVFRGTNHLESISAAAAVIDEIALHGRVIVSSHNLVLASILERRLSPMHVTRPDGVAKLLLVPGVLVQTNGISLLAERGFDRHVQDKANTVYNWLSSYLAHPAGTVEL